MDLKLFKIRPIKLKCLGKACEDQLVEVCHKNGKLSINSRGSQRIIYDPISCSKVRIKTDSDGTHCTVSADGLTFDFRATSEAEEGLRDFLLEMMGSSKPLQELSVNTFNRPKYSAPQVLKG
jgi:hypothetical protein